MKLFKSSVFIIIALVLLISCASRHSHYYNTQRGAVIGAGIGAFSGSLIGRDAEATLIGAGVGTLLGAIVGNAVDQQHQIMREAALTNKRLVYYDHKENYAIEAIPGPKDQHTKCRKVTKREWDKGYLVSERVEEICEGEKLTGEY